MGRDGGWLSGTALHHCLTAFWDSNTYKHYFNCFMLYNTYISTANLVSIVDCLLYKPNCTPCKSAHTIIIAIADCTKML